MGLKGYGLGLGCRVWNLHLGLCSFRMRGIRKILLAQANVKFPDPVYMGNSRLQGSF